LKFLDLNWPDHEMVEVACEYNAFNTKLPEGRSAGNFGMFKGPYNAARKCVNGKDLNTFYFDYAKQFFTAYSA
jgi:hypothetical protein